MFYIYMRVYHDKKEREGERKKRSLDCIYILTLRCMYYINRSTLHNSIGECI